MKKATCQKIKYIAVRVTGDTWGDENCEPKVSGANCELKVSGANCELKVSGANCELKVSGANC
jgi:hypothetical protein